jgi:hypothetical protein
VIGQAKSAPGMNIKACQTHDREGTKKDAIRHPFLSNSVRRD